MNVNTPPAIPDPSPDLLERLEGVYRDLHAHPELSMQETRTAEVVAGWLDEAGFAVTSGVGGTGVVGVLGNGAGATVLLRADMDALPVLERTGLAYASTVTGVDRFGTAGPVAHACGHDMHVTWLLGVSRLLAERTDLWRGTVIVVFQPGEETGEGAAAMVADRLAGRFPRPDVALGQHVVPAPAGSVALTSGIAMSASDSWEVTFHGRGAHGSMPQKSIDPIVMASSAVVNLQRVVAREVGMQEQAVLTVGSFHAGVSENTIPDSATIRLNVRSFDAGVRARVLGSIRRIVAAEAAAAGAPREPDITDLGSHPALDNDEVATRTVVDALVARFGAERVQPAPPATASEDFGVLAAAWGIPSVYWFVGGTDPDTFAAAAQAGTLDALPANHSPAFAPVIRPTLETGIAAMTAAAGAWLIAPPPA